MASSVFYIIFSWKYLLLLFVIALFNYFIGIKVIRQDSTINKSLYVTGILVNLFILCFFKYFNYLDIDLRKLSVIFDLQYPERVIRILFPLGLSYFIFTALSYLIDIKRQIIATRKLPELLKRVAELEKKLGGKS